MKRNTRTSLGFVSLGFVLMSGLAAGCGTVSEGAPTAPEAVTAAQSATLGGGDLSDDAARRVVFLREEEKLARDLYARFQTRWDHRAFANINRSEQRHVAMMGEVVAAYGLNDPMAEDVPGRFVDPELQALYDQLAAAGDVSLEAALGTGALVEETDIEDLQNALAETPPADLAAVYERMLAASGNHLRAFTRNLGALGVTYAPQVLPQADYDTLLAAPQTRGQGCGRGNGGGGACGGNCAGNGNGRGACGGNCAGNGPGGGTCDGNCAGNGQGRGQGNGNGNGRGN